MRFTQHQSSSIDLCLHPEPVSPVCRPLYTKMESRHAQTCLVSVQTTVHKMELEHAQKDSFRAGCLVAKVVAGWVVGASDDSAPAPTLLGPHLGNLGPPPSEARRGHSYLAGVSRESTPPFSSLSVASPPLSLSVHVLTRGIFL